MNLKHNFVTLSIEDIRDTIRAVDNKLNFLVAILVIPLTVFPGVMSETILIYGKEGPIFCLLKILIFLSFLSWLVSLFNVITGLNSITNPGEPIKSGRDDNSKGNGRFFTHNPEEISIVDQITLVPETDDNYLFELGYEQLKLARIRNIKIGYQKRAYRFFLLFIGCSSVASLIYLYLSI